MGIRDIKNLKGVFFMGSIDDKDSKGFRENEKVITAQTSHGKIKGTFDGKTAVFRGIPYGGPCDSARRFLPPVVAQDWDGVRDCTKNGYYAVQNGTSISGSEYFGEYFNGGHPEQFGVADEQQNENCLVLNVVTPGVDDRARSVLVYIHGGGFATGSGTLVLGSGAMACDEDIVIVGINHRLNIFGYLYLGAFDEKYASSGMAGMLDLVLALEWVRDNIANFGGDPEKVTIMGESGGGMKVSTLLAMPKARGLFRAAIVESGSNVVGRLSTAEAADMAAKALARLNIPVDRLDLLEKCSSAQLLAACVGGDASASNIESASSAESGDGDASAGNIGPSSNAESGGVSSAGSDFGGDLNFGPVADGINLAYQEENRFIAPEISKDIPLMVGSSEDEVGVFTPLDVLEKITWDNMREMLLLSKGGPLSGKEGGPLNEDNVDAVIETFKRTDKKANSADHLFLKINSLTSFLGGGSYYQAESKAVQGGAPVYHYVVAYDSTMPMHSERRYAWHTADLPLQMRIVLHPESEALSKIMSHAIGAFVRTCDPSTKALEWPALDLKSRQVMVFDDTCRVETDPWKEIRECLSPESEK